MKTTMNRNTAHPPTTSNRVCTHCNRTAEKVSTTETAHQIKRRVVCPMPSCLSTFSRPSDLVRHQKSIHGPKKKCVHTGCGYMTGRADKMKEHLGKMHQIVDARTDVVSGDTESSFETFRGQDVMEYNTIKMDERWFMAGTYVGIGYDNCWATPWDYVNVPNGLE